MAAARAKGFVVTDGTRGRGPTRFSAERELFLDDARRRREANHARAPQEPNEEHQRELLHEALRERFFDPMMATAYLLGHEAPPRDWIVEDLVPAHEGGLVIGAGGAGKGHFQAWMGCCISVGWNLGRFRVATPGKVLMVSREDDGREMHRRIRAAVALVDPVTFGKDTEWRERLEQNLHVVDIRGLRGVSIASQELIDVLGEKAARIGGVKLVMLDPLGRLLDPHWPALNTQEGAGLVHASIDAMVEQLATGVSMAHHVSKIGRSTRHDEDRGAGASSGSHLLEDLARYVLRLVPLSGQEARKKYDLDDKASYVEVSAPKMNYSATPSSMVFRRRAGGALDHVQLRDQLDVIDGRVLSLLVDAGADGLTREEWEEACQNSDPKIPINAARDSRKRLVTSQRIGQRDAEMDSTNGGRRRGKRKQIFFAIEGL